MNNPKWFLGYSYREISVKNWRYGPASPIAISPLNVIENDKYGSVPFGLNGLNMAGDILENCSCALVNKKSYLSLIVTGLWSFFLSYLILSL